MTFFSALSAAFQKDLTKSVNKVITNFAMNNATDCYNGVRQTLGILIVNSDVALSGELIAQQEAQVAMSCIQAQENSAELLQKLKKELEKEVTQKVKKSLIDVGALNVQIKETDLESIVASTITFDTSSVCKAQVDQSAVLQIKDSKVKLGCDNAQFDRAAALCNTVLQGQIAAGQKPDDSTPLCAALADCLQKRSNIFIDQGLKFTGTCNQAQSMVFNLAQQIDEKIQETTSQTVEGGSLLPDWLLYAIIGVAVLAFLGVLVKVFASRRNKPADLQGGAYYPAQQYYSAQPQQQQQMQGFASQPHTAGTSYSSAPFS